MIQAKNLFKSFDIYFQYFIIAEIFGYLLNKKEEVESDLVCGHVLGNPYVFLFAPEDIELCETFYILNNFLMC